MSIAARQSSAELQGRYIFAYRNFRTNQVIYSFRRILKQRDLNAQLPDLGANSKPAEVRLDSWKPLWTVTFPENTKGYYQGQAAYQALRKWRAKREIAGQRPPDLARPHTEAEIQNLKDRLRDRGGSKRETVWNLLKRAKRKLRVRSIMDQKTTSIADLAYVLQSQYTMGEGREKFRQNVLRPAELEALWTNGHNYEQNAEKVVTGLKAAQVALQDIYKEHPDRIINTPPVLELRAQIKKLKNKLTTIVFAANIVQGTKIAYAREQGFDIDEQPSISVEPFLQEASWKPIGSLIAERQHVKNPLEGLPSELFEEDVIKPRLPTFIGTGQQVPEALWASASAEQRRLMKKHWTPELTVDGIEIRWENTLDAEYANEWPAGVIHRAMGVVKHIANDPDMPPLLTAEDWTERGRVVREVAKLKALEAQPETDAATDKRLPIMVRRNEDGLIEHIYREMREELGAEGASQKQPEEVQKPRVTARREPSKAKLSAVLKKHAQELEHGVRPRPVIETIPIYEAPTSSSLRTILRMLNTRAGEMQTQLSDTMSEATPRISAQYLEQFTHRTIRMIGKVRQLRGEQATIDAGGNVSLHLNRDSHLQLNHAVEIIGKVGNDLSVRVLAATDFGPEGNIDFNAVDAVVDATHRYPEMFYDKQD